MVSIERKHGKKIGIASLQPLDSNTGFGGSVLIVEFCKDCGEVTSIKVKNPCAIK